MIYEVIYSLLVLIEKSAFFNKNLFFMKNTNLLKVLSNSFFTMEHQRKLMWKQGCDRTMSKKERI